LRWNSSGPFKKARTKRTGRYYTANRAPARIAVTGAHGYSWFPLGPYQEKPRMELKAGTAAPDFTLATHTGEKLSLSGFRGRRTVVSFLPFAFTGG
jgi:hypothetical protein